MALEKIKSYGIKTLVMLINLGLVGGGVVYIKNQQDKKKAAEVEQANNEAIQEAQQIATKADQLDQIIQQNSTEKIKSIANNPSEITVQQPKTVTTMIPGAAMMVKSSTPTPTKTTKKS